MLVRPALMLKSTEIFEYERKHSQRTGSVAKIAGGLEKVQPITKHEQRTNDEFTSVRPYCVNAFVSRCVSYRQADKNYKLLNYSSDIYEPANEASFLKEAKEVSNHE